MLGPVHQESYQKDFAAFERDFIKEHEAFYWNPAAYYMEPFRIAGNLYFVGDRMVCVHLIDTGEGLLLIDSGYQHTVHQLVHSVWKLGFPPEKIRWILHTHGHFDHFGATNAFCRLFGCKSYLSRTDAQSLREHPELALLSYNPDHYAELLQVDAEFGDGDLLTFGNTQIRCVETPGHTAGTMSFFFDVANPSGGHLRAGLFGGIGVLTMYRAFLTRYRLPLSLRQDFLHSLEKMRGERVDLVLGNHPAQNGTVEKRECMLAGGSGNPFVNPCEWSGFLKQTEERFRSFLALDHS